ncbi:MAG: hypothetical protein CBE43_05025 [Rhodopirellula sp. TMED283]|nr:MAG: hypothetical protein CBE43_05025 [Rhodopirellula sp. TMED283]
MRLSAWFGAGPSSPKHPGLLLFVVENLQVMIHPRLKKGTGSSGWDFKNTLLKSACLQQSVFANS